VLIVHAAGVALFILYIAEVSMIASLSEGAVRLGRRSGARRGPLLGGVVLPSGELELRGFKTRAHGGGRFLIRAVGFHEEGPSADPTATGTLELRQDGEAWVVTPIVPLGFTPAVLVGILFLFAQAVVSGPSTSGVAFICFFMAAGYFWHRYARSGLERLSAKIVGPEGPAERAR
jgi:hypothetical protein